MDPMPGALLEHCRHPERWEATKDFKMNDHLFHALARAETSSPIECKLNATKVKVAGRLPFTVHTNEEGLVRSCHHRRCGSENWP